MKQKTKYPKTASVVGAIAFSLFLLGFKSGVFFFLAAWFAIIAIILALGPNSKAALPKRRNMNAPTFSAHDLVYHDGQWISRMDAGYSS